VVLVLLLPIAGLGAVIVQQVIAGAEWFRGALQSEGVEGLLHRLPAPAADLARRALGAIPPPAEVFQRLAGRGGEAAAAVGGVLAATGSAVFQLAMTLVAFFFFLTDGHALIGWLDARVPLRPGQFRALVDDFRKTSVSVLVATVATAGIQTATALVGYLIARAPSPIFLAITTFVVALVPALGGTVAVVVVGLLLLATGSTISGLFLVAWAILAVALVDNVARPFLIKGGVELNGGVVFFALLGGVAVYGGLGLLIGPLAVTFLVSALRLYQHEFGGALESGGRPPADVAPPASGPQTGAPAGPPLAPAQAHPPLPALDAPASTSTPPSPTAAPPTEPAR
jgi:predicted PurR-regulated permease PerM